MRIQKKHLLSVLLLGVFGFTTQVHAAVNWNVTGSTVWSDGNVGIGNTYAADPLVISRSLGGGKQEGKAMIGDGVGSWWFIGGNCWQAMTGCNNIATNAYVSDAWYRRTAGYESWIISNNVSNRQNGATGYYKIFHADPEGSNTRISNLTPFFEIDSNGKTYVRELNVSTSNWPDYVFENDYKLRPLEDVDAYIKENKHLPDVPSKTEITEKGIDVGQMQKISMQKIEELTLYILDLQKQINDLKLNK